jgi:hypothetical protein
LHVILHVRGGAEREGGALRCTSALASGLPDPHKGAVFSTMINDLIGASDHP